MPSWILKEYATGVQVWTRYPSGSRGGLPSGRGAGASDGALEARTDWVGIPREAVPPTAAWLIIDTEPDDQYP